MQEVEGGRRDGAQNLHFFVADRLGIERRGRFHGDEGKELEDVILDHVPRGAGVVVISATRFDADLLRHRDLDVVDIAAIPERLVNRVCEPEVDQVLDGFLAEVVIDAEDILFGKGTLERAVQFLGALEVRAKRLLDDQAMTCAIGAAGQPGGGEVLRGLAEVLGRGRQVEEVILADLGALRQHLQLLRQAFVGLDIVQFSLEVVDARRQLLPDGVIDRLRVGELQQRLAQILAELVVGLGATGESDDREIIRQEVILGQVIEGRNDLAVGEIARGPEDDRYGWRNLGRSSGNHRRARRIEVGDGHTKLVGRCLQ